MPLLKPRISLQRLLFLSPIRECQDPSQNQTSRRPPLSPRGAKPFLQERLLQFQRGGAKAEGPSQRSRGRSRSRGWKWGRRQRIGGSWRRCCGGRRGRTMDEEKRKRKRRLGRR
ncbi:hypothetical protein CMV_024040 [Castanea mollissima]|uniref:Uncharacterized protein n=1 Tax=Castanea mollissima TaxID=60419 RepID=A0A8J4QS51_9ROSI|nr:hypothetical protein CMV_024040 [Castanea mollissima]